MMLTEVNTQLFMLINAAPNTSKLAITLATFCAQYLIYLPILIGAFCWFKKPTTREMICKMVVTILMTLLVAAIVRSLINSPRPFELALGTNYLPHSSSNSFPSKHAAFIFSITFALFCYGKNQLSQKLLFIASLLTAILICWARVYLGVHWPMDILAAVLVSLICAYMVNKSWLHIKIFFIPLIAKSHLILPDFITKFKVTKS